jgi:hypothetical protein
MATHPETVMVMLKARSEVIKRRMAEMPNPESPLRLKDVDKVLRAYDEEYENSLIRRRFAIDGSDLTVDAMFEQWQAKIQSFLAPIDMQRILARRALNDK